MRRTNDVAGEALLPSNPNPAPSPPLPRSTGGGSKRARRNGHAPSKQRGLHLLLLALLAIVSWARAQAPDERLPVPNSSAQAKVLKELKLQFKEQYAKRASADQLALCRQFVDQVPTYADDPAKQYVLLREARELAVNGGDLDLAFAVIDQTAKMFNFPADEYKVSAMTAAVDRATVPKEQLLAQYLRIADDALTRSDWDLAEPAAKLADRIDRASRNAASIERVKQTSLRVHDLRRELTKISAAFDKLRAHPDDPEACLLAGRYICFIKGAWEPGLPLLAKCSDPRLKELAEKDLARPSDTNGILEIADAWWDFPATPQTPARAAHQRAAYWYEQAVPRLSGEAKARAQQRVAEVNPKTQAGASHG